MNAADTTILVVEDDEVMRTLMVMILEPAGYQVVAAEDGRHALELLADGRLPTLAIVDWYMPIMSGQVLIKTLRGDPRYERIPLLVCSGSKVPIAAPEGAARIHRIDKPSDPAELLTAVRAILDD
jgi:two-component system chemotaxis response regulator CheY